jgi:hypothetical protein
MAEVGIFKNPTPLTQLASYPETSEKCVRCRDKSHSKGDAFNYGPTFSCSRCVNGSYPCIIGTENSPPNHLGLCLLSLAPSRRLANVTLADLNYILTMPAQIPSSETDRTANLSIHFLLLGRRSGYNSLGLAWFLSSNSLFSSAASWLHVWIIALQLVISIHVSRRFQCSFLRLIDNSASMRVLLCRLVALLFHPIIGKLAALYPVSGFWCLLLLASILTLNSKLLPIFMSVGHFAWLASDWTSSLVNRLEWERSQSIAIRTWDGCISQ